MPTAVSADRRRRCRTAWTRVSHMVAPVGRSAGHLRAGASPALWTRCLRLSCPRRRYTWPSPLKRSLGTPDDVTHVSLLSASLGFFLQSPQTRWLYTCPTRGFPTTEFAAVIMIFLLFKRTFRVSCPMRRLVAPKDLAVHLCHPKIPDYRIRCSAHRRFLPLNGRSRQSPQTTWRMVPPVKSCARRLDRRRYPPLRPAGAKYRKELQKKRQVDTMSAQTRKRLPPC